MLVMVVVIMIMFNVQRSATSYHAPNIFIFILLGICMYVETQDEVTQNEWMNAHVMMERW